jgi:hypothetical protein
LRVIFCGDPLEPQFPATVNRDNQFTLGIFFFEISLVHEQVLPFFQALVQWKRNMGVTLSVTTKINLLSRDYFVGLGVDQLSHLRQH